MENVLTLAFEQEAPKLRGFIGKRVADSSDVEDILQDVFYELIEADRLMKPIEQVGAWLFQVARNRIVDLFRRKKTESLDDETLLLERYLPSPEDGPDALYARTVMMDEIEAALAELPANQREVFVAHEVEGQSFKVISAATGVSVNTLLSRKRYAVIYLRERLEAIYKEFTKG